ncbi:MAG TPA: RsfA family transcriptional regulator [Pseudogracilibacillus sp.]|nr:RsfA family transcriptional regulator [Pseudogracilibacillus sp.]
MNRPRQDAWTKDEDMLLAEIVLRHIRSGKTQLEAFKQAGEALSRTAAACGFRWNATIRKNHIDAINIAKNSRKQSLYEKAASMNPDERQTIESAISMLEKVRQNVIWDQDRSQEEQEQLIAKLKAENNRLEKEIKRYREAWSEMKNVWEWIENKNEH